MLYTILEIRLCLIRATCVLWDLADAALLRLPAGCIATRVPKVGARSPPTRGGHHLLWEVLHPAAGLVTETVHGVACIIHIVPPPRRGFTT